MIRMICALLAAAAWFAAPTAQAQGYPRGAITLVVPLAPGDGGDTTARALADELSRQLQVPVVVTNRPGAGGALGVQSVIGARKDGATLLFTQNGALTVRRVLEPQAANYDPLKDLTPLAITTRTPTILAVRKDAPYNTLEELIAQARRAPGGVRLGSAGSGSAGELSTQLIATLAGVDITSVPYKGAAPALTDALGGQIDGVLLALGAVAPHLKSGALKPIAISSRHPELPEVPTLRKLGYRQDMLGVWFGFFAPAGVPAEVIQVLVPALDKAAHSPAIASRLLPLGIVPDWEPPARLAAEIAAEYEAVSDLYRRLQPKKP